MADFVAVLRKTIGTLGDNTPEMREKVYEKARATIEMKLKAIQPPPPAAVIDRQRKALEDAIAVVRADYAGSSGADGDEDLEDVFASLKSMGEVRSPPPLPPRAVSAPPPASPPSEPAEAPAPPPSGRDPVLDPPEETADAAGEVVDASGDDGEAVSPPEALVAAARERRAAASSRSRRPAGLIAALVLLLAVAGGGYAVWLNKDDLFGSSPPPPVVAETAPEEEGVTTAEELVEAAPQEEEPEAVEEEIAALPGEPEPEAEAPEPAVPSAAAGPEKFTQRLLPDGSEVDDGPAGGQRTIGEGTSVAAASQAQQPAPATDAQPEAGAAEPAGAAAQETTPAMAVGQRAIFYEERTSSAQGSAELGSIVWSVVREAPGSDLPAEPAIRAEANVPGKDVQLRMTIRRNGDETLPASHIVEMIFLTPEGFEGGAISNVSRISFKETEQAAGSPLIGIPAKIADGFFLIALGDAPAEIEANMTLLRRQSWIDIPIVYQSGRRALLSLEKGIPGDRVFQEALEAWSEATAG